MSLIFIEKSFNFILEEIDSASEKEIEEQQELVKGAAKIYFSLQDENETCIKVQTLIDNGYLSDSKIDKLDKDYSIRFDSTNNEYIYSSASCE